MNRQSITRLIASLSIVSILLLSGCNTLQGAGRDIERAGEEIQEIGD